MGRILWTGAMLILAALSILSNSSHAATCEGPNHTATSGAVFKRDCTRPALGKAFKDSTGLIWGAVIADAGGNEIRMSTQEAMSHCRKAGGRLPTAAEFENLAQQISGNGQRAYSPAADEGSTVITGLNNWLMTAPDDSKNFENEEQHFFVGAEGYLVSGGGARGSSDAIGAFLCVTK